MLAFMLWSLARISTPDLPTPKEGVVMIIWLIVAVAICTGLWFLINLIPATNPFRRIAQVAFIIICILVLCGLLLQFLG